jgi:hypothetical protein
MMKMKRKTMMGFGAIMFVFNLLGAGYFYWLHDRGRVLMFLCGSVLWVVMMLIWNKVDDNV